MNVRLGGTAAQFVGVESSFAMLEGSEVSPEASVRLEFEWASRTNGGKSRHTGQEQSFSLAERRSCSLSRWLDGFGGGWSGVVGISEEQPKEVVSEGGPFSPSNFELNERVSEFPVG